MFEIFSQALKLYKEIPIEAFWGVGIILIMFLMLGYYVFKHEPVDHRHEDRRFFGDFFGGN